MNSQKAIALLSGGLDSVVSMGMALDLYEVKRSLYFDYGQRAALKEEQAAKKISDYYKIPCQTIKLDWLADITSTSLVNKDCDLPEYTLEQLDSDTDYQLKSAKAVWVPNRNGVMLNIAASIAESLGCRYVVFGANAEEATTFPDNTKEYADKLSNAFAYSTNNRVEVSVPLNDLTKTEIVSCALNLKVPLELVWSCYLGGEKHCGKCESCVRLKRALLSNNQSELWKDISAYENSL
jgi:7-cyano-7-deazaguanine synthase